MNNNLLVELYNQASKHSSYQILAEPLREHVPPELIKTKSRFEQERLDYILNKVSIAKASIADIGGNTGFFTFELINRGAASSLFIEGNEAQALFVQEAAKIVGFENKVDVHQRYLSFEDELSLINVDICFLLNVLHHVGDDYNSDIETIEAAKEQIIFSLNQLSQRSKILVFQLGFNWKGNVSCPLFAHGEKREQIEFISAGTEEFWDIKGIGIAGRTATGIVYDELNSENIIRMDELGEFLNRPLFILESKSRD